MLLWFPQGATNSDVKQSDSWDVWNAASAEDSSSAAKWNEANDSDNNKGWKSDGKAMGFKVTASYMR
jgi:hypothetical protein